MAASLGNMYNQAIGKIYDNKPPNISYYYCYYNNYIIIIVVIAIVMNKNFKYFNSLIVAVH